MENGNYEKVIHAFSGDDKLFDGKETSGIEWLFT